MEMERLGFRISLDWRSAVRNLLAFGLMSGVLAVVFCALKPCHI